HSGVAAGGALVRQLVSVDEVGGHGRVDAGGDTRVAIALASGGVSASAERTVRLPSLAVTERAPAPVPQVVGDPGFLGSRAALLVGAGAFAVALAVVGGFLFRPRETRVRLFGRGRGTATERLGVSHFAEQATAAAERALARRGLASGVNGRLERAGLDLRAGEYVVLTATAAIALFAAGALMGSPVVGFVLGALVVAAASVVLDHLARRRAQRFADQLADTLQMISGSLRAGYSFLQATDTVSREASSPTAEEFNRMLVEIRLGRDFSDALRAMHARIGNEDFEWFIQAVEIQREVGGDLAQILDTVAGTIRERNRLRRQVKALSAEGRLSAIILFALPFVVGGFITVTNPDYLSPLTETTTGTLMLGFAGVLLGVGGLWLRKIIRLVF
ncbi:MAG TPA: type II secretion system F family protein, partial [Acidimicrobiia bacterium]|nr:type II secretion system F family protein [Acidimicrobiia bacterium]